MNKNQVEKCTILQVISGSIAYGFNTKNSDIDIRGICIPPKEYFLTPEKRFDQYDVGECAIYNIMKYFKLAMDNNPNILELLWIDKPEHIQYMDKYGQKLRNTRKSFLSMKVKHTYSGYAFAQLKRIETHRKWLLDPPIKQPERFEYGLDDTKVLNVAERGAINKLINDGHVFNDSVLKFVQKENEYQRDLTHWNQYLNWKKTRNEKRAELEAKYGYDTKHATHLVRLMRQGIEILKTGKLIVYRPDAKELLSIRQGAWSYDKLIGYAKELEIEMNELYEKPKKCAVPWQCNRNKLGNLCMEMLETYWNDKEKMSFMGKIIYSLGEFKDLMDIGYMRT